MKIPIPESINDPRLNEISRQIFVEICGGKISKQSCGSGAETGIIDYNHYHFSKCDHPLHVTFFQPFTRIQDTKLCDPWVVGNDLLMRLNFNRHGKCAARIFELNNNDYSIAYEFDMSEAFARMVAIIKAFNKLQEEIK